MLSTAENVRANPIDVEPVPKGAIGEDSGQGLHLPDISDIGGEVDQELVRDHTQNELNHSLGTDPEKNPSGAVEMTDLK